MNVSADAASRHAPSISFVTVVNDHAELGHNLLASPVKGSERHEWLILDNVANRASQDICALYCEGLRRACHDLVFFIHPDVYLPENWEADVYNGLRLLDDIDPAWGVIGAAGNLPMGSDGDVARGHWADPQHQQNCRHGPLPSEVFSLDECWLGLRKSRGIAFDSKMPGFHCYGLDLCLTARTRGARSYAIDAFIWHKFKDPAGNRIASAAESGENHATTDPGLPRRLWDQPRLHSIQMAIPLADAVDVVGVFDRSRIARTTVYAGRQC